MFFFECRTIKELVIQITCMLLVTTFFLLSKWMGVIQISYMLAFAPLILFLGLQVLTILYYVVIVFIEKDF